MTTVECCTAASIATACPCGGRHCGSVEAERCDARPASTDLRDSLPLMFRQMLWRPDVVFAVGLHWSARRQVGSSPPVWREVMAARAGFRDRHGVRLGLLKGRRLRSVVEAAERWILRRFDGLPSISRGMLKRAESKGVDPDNLLYFPNWVDVGNIKPLSAPSSYRAELGVSPDAVVALYSGSLRGRYGR